MLPLPSRADFWGGDVVVLTQILLNAVQQLIQLRQILQTGSDALNLTRDLNQGIRNGLSLIKIINPQFNPGLYGNLETAAQVQSAITQLYGAIPQTAESQLQETQDQSVSQSIAMNGQLFRFADQVDAESKNILALAPQVSPQGAGKLTAQSLGILIGVTTQVLRTNSMMLKMMAENMALQNRKEKISSSQFRTQYDGLTNAFGSLPKKSELPSLKKGE
jgi:hypothetical protein